MAPPSANPTQGKKAAASSSTSTTSNSSKKAPASAAPAPADAAGKGPAAAPKPAAEVDVKLTAAVDKVLAAEEKEKRVKAIKKKLKQLDEIKAKVAENQPIDADQVHYILTLALALTLTPIITEEEVGRRGCTAERVEGVILACYTVWFEATSS